MGSAETPSRQVLDETPARALKLLSAVSKSPRIHAALAERGYTEADHQEGWDLLLSVSGYRRGRPPVADDEAVRKAVVELDLWDEPNFRLIRAALDRRHPEQSRFVFENLAPATGNAAVVSVATLLARLDALDNAPERKATRKEDHAALATLAQRGVDKAERDRLRALVDVARRTPQADGGAADDGRGDTAHDDRLGALHAWYTEWSETARAVIKRRDDLIRLGLAKRKKAGTKGAAPGDTPPNATPTPA